MLPAVLVHPGPPSIHLCGQTRAAPTGRSLSVGKGWQCQGLLAAPGAGGRARGWWQCQRHVGPVAFEGTERPWAAAGGQRCHRGVTSGVALLSPSLLLRARPRAGVQGWQPPGALPARGGPPDGFCSESFLPGQGGVWGLGAGPAGAAERDEGRFPKLYFSAGSFRVNELTS